MQPPVLLCLGGTCSCALSFILLYLPSVGLSLHPFFFSRREFRKTVGPTFRFWQSSAFRLIRAKMCFKAYSLNKPMFENVQNVCQMLVKYCYMIGWLISYRYTTKSSGAELPFFLLPCSLPLFSCVPLFFLALISQEDTQRQSCRAQGHETHRYSFSMSTRFLQHNTKLSSWEKKK